MAEGCHAHDHGSFPRRMTGAVPVATIQTVQCDPLTNSSSGRGGHA